MYTMVFLRLSILLHNAYYDIFLQSNQVSLLFCTNLWKHTCGRKTEGKKGFVCKVCGYIYEGDVLPDDFVCPLCKHGAIDFEPIQ